MFRNGGPSRTRSRSRASLEMEVGRDVQERGPEDGDEHRREDEQRRREEHLDRRLHRTFLRRSLTPQPGVGSLDAEDAAERDAELLRLDDGADERGDRSEEYTSE